MGVLATLFSQSRFLGSRIHEFCTGGVSRWKQEERERVTPLCVDNKIYEPLILEAKEEEK
jgi:hypothetical protein